jgi:hypothetical protein
VALAAYPGGVIDRVVKVSNGEYEAHNIGVNWPHHVFVNQELQGRRRQLGLGPRHVAYGRGVLDPAPVPRGGGPCSQRSTDMDVVLSVASAMLDGCSQVTADVGFWGFQSSMAAR